MIAYHKIVTGSRTANLNSSHDVEYGDDFGPLGSNTANAGRWVATQTCVFASAQGHDNTVSATQLHELYMASLGDEVAHDIELPSAVQYQHDGLTPKCRIHKDQLIDPTPDIDYIDYERQPRPWEEEGISEKMVPVVTPTDIPGEAEEIMGLAEKYRDIFSSSLNRNPAKLDAMKLKVDEEAWRSKSIARPPRPNSALKNDEIFY